MGFLRVQFWVHSILSYTQPLLVQSYLNSMSPIFYKQMIHKFTWNVTLGTLNLVQLNWQTALMKIQAWMGNNKLKLNPNKIEFIVIYCKLH